jgi:GTP pyrophosphokinase
VPLNYSLQTGEQVEIITSKHGTPSRDWLNPNLGYVTTSRARAKIVHWFKLQARDQNVAAGKTCSSVNWPPGPAAGGLRQAGRQRPT